MEQQGKQADRLVLALGSKRLDARAAESAQGEALATRERVAHEVASCTRALEISFKGCSALEEAAGAAISRLCTQDIDRLKALPQPPEPVERLCCCTANLLLGQTHSVNWDSARRLTARIQPWKTMLKSLKAETIPVEVLDTVEAGGHIGPRF